MVGSRQGRCGGARARGGTARPLWSDMTDSPPDSPRAAGMRAGEDLMHTQPVEEMAINVSIALMARPRWADMADSSQEAPFESSPADAPVAEDSYRSAPISDLESSKTGINGRLKSAANLEAPKDFAFLLRGSAQRGDSRTSAVAPEFVPIMRAAGEDCASSTSGSTTGGRVACAGPSRRGSARSSKRRESDAASSQAPAGKRAKGEPAGSEEDWQHREEKRYRALNIVKASEEYQTFAAARANGTICDTEPKTPDAKDRSITKRSWEKEIQHWRLGLRKWSETASLCSELTSSSIFYPQWRSDKHAEVDHGLGPGSAACEAGEQA